MDKFDEGSILARLQAVEHQLMRVVSHLESESLFCRRDHGRLESLLSGNGKDINNLERDLFGNGQPGTLKDIERRVKKLEVYAGSIAGGLAVVSVLMGIILYIMKVR